MDELVEGKLIFAFPLPLRAEKYDDWSFYRNQLTNAFGGAKAVDILCLDTDCGWLIEVKDYRQHRRTKPSELGMEIAEKVRDTLAGLVAARCNANDKDEKSFAAEFLAKKTLRVVLHLEQPVGRNSIINPANLVIKLRQLLKPVDAHPQVVSQNALRGDMTWTVKG